MKEEKGTEEKDLGFRFVQYKNGELDLSHQGRVVTHFNRSRSASIMNKMLGRSFEEQQIIMARLTGNYKRGNERQSKTKEG
mgnify:FL=1